MTSKELVGLIVSDLENYQEMENMLNAGNGSVTIDENTESMRHYERFGCGVVVCFMRPVSSESLNPQFGIIHSDDDCYCLNDLNFDAEESLGDSFLNNSMSVFWIPSLIDAYKRTIEYLDSAMEKDGPWYRRFKEI